MVLGTASGTVTEDPFGPGDPLEVARLVRRALAAAGRKALEVAELLVIADAPVAPSALERFTRRALGPHGSTVRSASRLVPTAWDHPERLRAGTASGAGPGPDTDHGWVAIVVVLGPRSHATVLCVRSSQRSGGRRA